jgi:hypothetical protein
MGYELMGRLHAAALRRARGGMIRAATRAGRRGARARDASGQGTVEYVGLVLLVAVILAGVVKASAGFDDDSIAQAVVEKLEGAIDGVGKD